MTDNGICVICNGERKFVGDTCMFCNGTGEWNQAGEDYLKNHICQCECLDRKWCPVCHKICHHDTTNSPAQFIIPGYGGESTSIQLNTSNLNSVTESIQEEEEFITA